jgi:L-ascorbate metabolism protein UlaG (beta-lactamase superfamily)
MKIQQIRNATALVELGAHRILVDPMLAAVGELPGFKLFGGGRRPNPLVALPDGAMQAMERATCALVTHEHADHLDGAAVRWIKARGLTVWASAVDAPNLGRKGLKVEVIRDGALGMRVEVIAGQHGRGVMGWLMGPVSGFYLAHPEEPSLYITGDAVMTAPIRDALARLAPDVVLAPAGAANFGAGADILFSLKELDELARLAPGALIFNHLEALDHCPTTRRQLAQHLLSHGERIKIPEDGESIELTRRAGGAVTLGAPDTRRPGLQKWLTSKLG